MASVLQIKTSIGVIGQQIINPFTVFFASHDSGGKQ
ncbi:hypothetical protein COLO4_01923 [Corchorus olitorius]|uniref:Uncharacterized protein n=1 Tax=Corchorus olitorius TaxID=93759 RepID=A0A1R3L1R6_9ROSI|nr:hypothetical protein COLO4_01923 [Corchorus olitorius]